MISENRNGEQTSYTYGLERISALSGSTRTEYVYDGRGSVAAEVSYNNAWYTLGGGLGKKQVTSKTYTPFGEQIGEATSGFGYNGEYYNAATGMIYLRARFYAPEMNRFSQKDTLRGSVTQPGSLNRYLYCQNDPVNFVDPSGESVLSALKSTGSRIKSAVSNVKTAISNAVSSVKTAVSNVASSIKTKVSNIASSGERFNNAMNKMLGGITYGGIGIAAVEVASAVSAPLGIALLIAAAATASTSYGMAEFTEGVNELSLAAYGDTSSTAYNPLRDTLFGQNQNAYDTYGDIGMFGSGVSIASAPMWGNAGSGACSRSGSGSSGKSILSPGRVTEYAKEATKGSADSRRVVIGKYIRDSVNSYEQVAGRMNAQYFDLDNWSELSSTYSREEIWRINEEFLSQQILSGNDIYLSSNPFQYIGDGSYYSSEIQYLIDAGFRFVEEPGGVWHAVK